MCFFSEKSSLVAKLKAARVRKKKETGCCEGRRSAIDKNPEMLIEARGLRRKNLTFGKRMFYEKVSKALFALGFMTAKGNPYQRDFVYKFLKR